MTESGGLPPPGKKVDVGGFALHYVESGQAHDGPTVVLEAGFGDFHLDWEPVQAKIADFARVVSYDRAGLGWSDPSLHPRDADHIVQELAAMLENAGIPGPYVMVGHSAGGIYVRRFYQAHPGRVAGMVLVDSDHENRYQRLPEVAQQQMEASIEPILKTFRRMSQQTVEELQAEFDQMVEEAPDMMKAFSDEAVAAFRDRMRPVAYAARLAEAEALFASWKEPVKTLPDMGDLPLFVISAQFQQTSPRLDEETNQEVVVLRMELQNELAKLSTRGMHNPAMCGHYVQHQLPDVVVTAVRQVMAMIGPPA